jgi:hypothetical protein
MDRPQTPHEWQAFFEQRARKLEAARNRAERERPPAEPQGWIPHPLLLRRDNHRFEREAEQWHADLRERQRREAEQKNRPHPLVVGPLASIPIPERKSKPKKQAAEPILTTSQQVLLDEAIARASAEPDKRGGRLGHDDAGATSDLCFRSSTRGLFQNTYRSPRHSVTRALHTGASRGAS